MPSHSGRSSLRKSISDIVAPIKCFSRRSHENDMNPAVPVSELDRRRSTRASISSGHSASDSIGSSKNTDAETRPIASEQQPPPVMSAYDRRRSMMPGMRNPSVVSGYSSGYSSVSSRQGSIVARNMDAGPAEPRYTAVASSAMRAMSLPNIYEENVPDSLATMMFNTKAPEEADPYSEAAKKKRYTMPVQAAAYDDTDWWNQHD